MYSVKCSYSFGSASLLHVHVANHGKSDHVTRSYTEIIRLYMVIHVYHEYKDIEQPVVGRSLDFKQRTNQREQQASCLYPERWTNRRLHAT